MKLSRKELTFGMIDRRKFIAAQVAFGAISASWPYAVYGGPDTGPGQLLISGFRGTKASDPEVKVVRGYIEAGNVAGVMLLRRNIRSPEQLGALISSLHEASRDLPPIISIDQEGGAVSRLGPFSGFSEWVSAAELAQSGRSNAEILAYYSERALEMANVGINLNLGPVVDLNTNPYNPIIGSNGRAYGRSVEEVVRFAELFVRAHHSAGVKTCLKHFPGHGSSMEDSHKGTVDVSQTWSAEEIDPFERLVTAGFADMIMNAHLLHKYLSDSPWIPTSLSRRSVEEMREGLKFAGPVVTDDMQMGAITDLLTAPEAAVSAVKAGNSLLIYSNFEDRYGIKTVSEIGQAVSSAVDRGEISSEELQAKLELVRSFRSQL